MLNKLKEQLAEILSSKNTDEFTYKTEWLGYLPYGQYHWIEVKGEDISLTLCDWTWEDLSTLEEQGVLIQMSHKLDRDEPGDRSIVFRLDFEKV